MTPAEKKLARKRKGIAKERRIGKRYSKAEKEAACLEYQVLGNFQMVSRNLNIPAPTLRDWSKTEWWADCKMQQRTEAEDLIEAQLLRNLSLAHERINEGLTEGDERVHVNSKGEITRYRVKPTAKDAATIAGIAYDKRRLSLNLPTSIKGENQGLNDLAEQFRQLTETFNEKKINSIEGESEVISGG